MTDFEKALVDRDRVTREEARRERDNARNAMCELIDGGCCYDEVEDMLLCDYGLEMDYLFDLI